MPPFDIAITNDGQYGYLTYDIPPAVIKIRLSDLAIIGTTDLSTLSYMQCQNLALDVTEKKLFAYSRTWKKLLVIDTDSMTLSRTIDDYPLIGMTRSLFGTRLITWDGGATIRIVDTDTLAVTVQDTLADLFIERIEELSTDQSKWYVVARTQPGGQGPLTVGIFDHVTGSWDDSVTFSTQEPGESVFALKNVAADNKVYLATFGGWYPAGGAYGWLYSVDLTEHQASAIAIDGGALCLAARPDIHRLYVGAGWPVPNDKNLLVVDTQLDTIVGQIPLGMQAYGWPHTQMNALLVDPSNRDVLYATGGDSNSFIKVRLDSLSVEGAVVFNQEDVPSQSFAKRPGHDSGYIVLRNRAVAIDLDTGGAVVSKVVTLPLTPAWSYGAVVNGAGHLFMNQGTQILETDEPDLGHAVAHDLSPDLNSLWALRLSSNGRLLYSVAQSSPGGGMAGVFVAINTTSFQVEARIPLADIPHAWRPYEVPDQAKVYVLGGEPAGPVTIDVIETAHHTLQKHITFDEPGLLGASVGSADPFAYDPASHTLFVGATEVILAIDTETDTISRVIRLDDSVKAIGLEPGQPDLHQRGRPRVQPEQGLSLQRPPRWQFHQRLRCGRKSFPAHVAPGEGDISHDDVRQLGRQPDLYVERSLGQRLGDQYGDDDGREPHRPARLRAGAVAGCSRGGDPTQQLHGCGGDHDDVHLARPQPETDPARSNGAVAGEHERWGDVGECRRGHIDVVRRDTDHGR